MLTDTHCHLDDQSYQNDLEEVLKNAYNLGFILNPGCDLKTSQVALNLAKKYPKIYAAVGIHPSETGNYNIKTLDYLNKLAQDDKVLAIGEIGLDYHYEDNPNPEIQKKAFRDQIELARDLKIPYIVHDRESHQDILDIIKEYPNQKCVVHAFSGDLEMAKELIEMDNYLSVGGVLTFKNANDLRKVIKEIPIEKILLETDGPYLTPVPYRGKRNQPAYVEYVANTLARIKEIPVETIVTRTAQNAREFFEIEF